MSNVQKYYHHRFVHTNKIPTWCPCSVTINLHTHILICSRRILTVCLQVVYTSLHQTDCVMYHLLSIASTTHTHTHVAETGARHRFPFQQMYSPITLQCSLTHRHLYSISTVVRLRRTWLFSCKVLHDIMVVPSLPQRGSENFGNVICQTAHFVLWNVCDKMGPFSCVEYWCTGIGVFESTFYRQLLGPL